MQLQDWRVSQIVLPSWLLHIFFLDVLLYSEDGGSTSVWNVSVPSPGSMITHHRHIMKEISCFREFKNTDRKPTPLSDMWGIYICRSVRAGGEVKSVTACVIWFLSPRNIIYEIVKSLKKRGLAREICLSPDILWHLPLHFIESTGIWNGISTEVAIFIYIAIFCRYKSNVSKQSKWNRANLRAFTHCSVDHQAGWTGLNRINVSMTGSHQNKWWTRVWLHSANLTNRKPREWE
jgi:hypothetical protein